MRKSGAIYALVLLFVVGVLLPAGRTQAATASVKVTLPAFKVSLNGHTVDNRYRQYPLLVYRGVTYIPMTWSDTRLLGLETSWSPATGLAIQQNNLVTSSFAPYKSGKRNAASYFAKISTSPATVNGKAIDNAKEPYPLLSFRNVGYFPLTWRFAHDEFGWDYKWDAAGGLRITSSNPQLQTAPLPAYAGKNDVALFKGYYYFVETTGTTNHIYRAPVSQPSAKKEIHTYTFYPDSEWGPEYVTFQIRDQALWFTYHRGSGFMGHDEFFKISDDGKAKLVGSGYFLDFRETLYGTLTVNSNIMNDYGYLYFQKGTDRTFVGDPNILMFAEPLMDKNGLTATTVVNDDVYALYRNFYNDSKSGDPSIYKINLKTNKMDKLVSGAAWFRIANDKLYYTKSADRAFYSSALDGSGETKLSKEPVTWFDTVGGNVFFKTETGLYKLDASGNNSQIWKSPIADVAVVDDKLLCQIGSKEGFVVLDSSGNLEIKAADPIKKVLASDKLFVRLTRDSSLQLLR